MAERPRRVWITGASSGLGAALARACVVAGDEAWLSARPGARLDDTVAALGPRAHALPLDVTDRDQLHDALTRLEHARGLPDLTILNAGTYQPQGLANFDAEAIRALFALNVFAITDTLAWLTPRLAARGHGQVALVGSVAADIGLPYAGPYSASKAALVRLAQALRPEFERAGLVLSLVEPGFVRTPLTALNDFPMPFLMDADDAAHAILHGLDRGRFRVRVPWTMSVLMRLFANLPEACSMIARRRMLRH
ncbi:MAG: SDR family NAD(P)-dependent oxidoreductase [Gammaproteobacteria bacterium]